jgi:hypothetical protein
MDASTSPYGEVCGVAMRGTEQIGEQRVLFAVTLLVDEGVNVLPMRLSPDSPRTEVTWDGVSTLKYVAVLRSGSKVTGNFTCVHEAHDEQHSLELCVSLIFHPHGWVRFERASLVLNREDVLKLDIPLSIKETHMFRSLLSMPDIERLYGKSLADKHGDDDGGDGGASAARENGTNVATYRELPWARRKSAPAGRGALPTLARAREDVVLNEVRQMKEVLEPRWKERVAMLVVSLLRNKERTLVLIRKWHAFPMFQNRKPHEIWRLFMEAVLYSPLRLQITQSALFLFQETALAIPLEWLSVRERIIASEMVVARKELFRNTSESRVTAQYKCKDFRLDALLDKLVCRNLVVHLFVSDCVTLATLKDRERPTLLSVTLEAVGWCMTRHKENRFLYFLKRALERRTVVQDVAHMGMYVQIGDCVPSYTYEPPERGQHQATRRPTWTPK